MWETWQQEVDKTRWQEQMSAHFLNHNEETEREFIRMRDWKPQNLYPVT